MRWNDEPDGRMRRWSSCPRCIPASGRWFFYRRGRRGSFRLLWRTGWQCCSSTAPVPPIYLELSNQMVISWLERPSGGVLRTFRDGVVQKNRFSMGWYNFAIVVECHLQFAHVLAERIGLYDGNYPAWVLRHYRRVRALRLFYWRFGTWMTKSQRLKNWEWSRERSSWSCVPSHRKVLVWPPTTTSMIPTFWAISKSLR